MFSVRLAPDDVAEIVVEATSQLMSDNLTENILACLTSLDWATDLAPLQKHAALGDPHHVSTVSLLHGDIRQNLADCLYCYAAQSGLPTAATSRLLDHLSRVGPGTAVGALDDVTTALVMAALAAIDVSGVNREEGASIPVVSDPKFISAISR